MNSTDRTGNEHNSHDHNSRDHDGQDIDLSYDAPGLFAHLREIGEDPQATYLWSFGFSADEVPQLEAVVEHLGQTVLDLLSIEAEQVEFELAEESVYVADDGSETPGPPYLSLEFTGVLGEAQLKQLHTAFQAACDDSPVSYEGLVNFELPEDEVLEDEQGEEEE